MFTRKKEDRKLRTILNLNYLYKHVKSHLDIFEIIQPHCCMASVDQIYVFYSIPIFNDHQKYLKFEWLEKIYYFTGIPNGYSEAMRIFNKILKPSFFRLLH